MLYPWRRRRCQRRRPAWLKYLEEVMYLSYKWSYLKKNQQQQTNIKYSLTDYPLVIDQYMTK